MRRLLPLILLVLISTGSVLAKEWRGLLPMHSTREDVERLLGPPPPPDRSYTLNKTRSIYYLDEGEVYIVFANEELLKLNNCDAVPLGTVLMIQVTPKDETLVSSLQLDEKTFKKFNPSRDPSLEVEGFMDEKEGLVIRAAKGKVDRIVYLASALDRGRCPGYFENLEKFVEVNVFVCGRAFDEYGNIPFSDEKARLDNFAIQLQNVEKEYGFIIVYAGRKATYGEAQIRAHRARDYLINVRGIAPERVKAVDGGFREELSVLLYVVPDGWSPPAPDPTVDPSEVEIISNKPRRPKRKRN